MREKAEGYKKRNKELDKLLNEESIKLDSEIKKAQNLLLENKDLKDNL